MPDAARRRSRGRPTACSSTTASAFADAAAIAPYLARLGISHVYASPYLKARPGSTHGYDIVDHDQLNPELGDEPAFRAMVAALRARTASARSSTSCPNHMGVGGTDNPCGWMCWSGGRIRIYAGWFDIDWDPDRRYLREKLLVPLLGDQYGAVLEAGKLELRFDAGTGSFAVWAYDTHKLPICPLHYAARARQRASGAGAARRRLLRPAGLAAADGTARRGAAGASSAALAPRAHGRAGSDRGRGRRGSMASRDDSRRWRELDALIQDQHWRAAHFRVAADDINYRRFFNINELAGLRMELPEVFEHAHRLSSSCCARACWTACASTMSTACSTRKGYLERLRGAGAHGRSTWWSRRSWRGTRRCARTGRSTAPPATNSPTWCSGLLVDPAGEAASPRPTTDFTGEHRAVRRDRARLQAAHHAQRDGQRAQRARARCGPRGAPEPAHRRFHPQHPAAGAAGDRRLLPGLPHLRGRRPARRPRLDRRDLDWAVAQARRNETDVDPSVFDFLHRLLISRPGGRSRAAASAATRCCAGDEGAAI